MFWNPAAEVIFGYPAAEAIGSPIEMLMPERMRELHRHRLARFNRTGHGGNIDSHTPIELLTIDARTARRAKPASSGRPLT